MLIVARSRYILIINNYTYWRKIMRNYEINGNLVGESNLDFAKFSFAVCKVMNLYIEQFGEELMNSIDLLIDNAIKGSGYTPIITPVLGKYLIIKLDIENGFQESVMAHQFSHELMHYVFYAIQGLDKEKANAEEESICTAASLIVIKYLYPEDFDSNYEYVKNIEEEEYRKVAESVDFSFQKLKELVYAKTGYQV